MPTDEQELVEALRNMRDTREFGVQLIMYVTNNNPNYQEIAKYSTPEEKRKIGYISDLALGLKNYNVLRLKTIKSLEQLSRHLQDTHQNSHGEWLHLTSRSELAEKLAEKDPKKETNYKWRVLPGTYKEDILDQLDLYHPRYLHSKGAKQNIDKFYQERGMNRLRL